VSKLVEHGSDEVKYYHFGGTKRYVKKKNNGWWNICPSNELYLSFNELSSI